MYKKSSSSKQKQFFMRNPSKKKNPNVQQQNNKPTMQNGIPVRPVDPTVPWAHRIAQSSTTITDLNKQEHNSSHNTTIETKVPSKNYVQIVQESSKNVDTNETKGDKKVSQERKDQNKSNQSNSRRWEKIDQRAVQNANKPPNNQCPDDRIKKMNFNNAIKYLNEEAKKGNILHLEELRLILKKFNQRTLTSSEDDLYWLFDYIIKQCGDDEDWKDAIAREMILYYLNNVKEKKMSIEESIKKSVEIFDNYGKRETTSALLQLYVTNNLYKEAYELCNKTKDEYRKGLFYESYFELVYVGVNQNNIDKDECIKRLRELYNNTNKNDLDIGHCYRKLLELYRDYLRSKQNCQILEEAKKIYDQIPENEDKDECIKRLRELYNNTNKNDLDIGHSCRKLLELYCDYIRDEQNRQQILEEMKKIYDQIPENEDKDECIKRLRELYNNTNKSDLDIGHSCRKLLELYCDYLRSKQIRQQILEEAKKIYHQIPENLNVDPVRRAMLKIILDIDFEEAKDFFEKDLENYEHVTDNSYVFMLGKIYKKCTEYALIVLSRAFKNNFLKTNEPKEKNGKWILDCHRDSNTIGGKPFHEGSQSWFVELLLLYTLKLLKEKANRTNQTYQNLEIIVGKSRDENGQEIKDKKSATRKYVERILNQYDIINWNEKTNNSGCLQVEVKREALNKVFME
jgi:hypothetical protein